MNIKIDFDLNRQFDTVERIIFRLVLSGITDSRIIAEALPLFSDSVISNSIKHLVNRQILTAEIETRTLSVSEPIVAIINMCLEKSFDIEVSQYLEEKIRGNGLELSDANRDDKYMLNKAIIHELLPEIKLDIYVESLDFILLSERGHSL